MTSSSSSSTARLDKRLNPLNKTTRWSWSALAKSLLLKLLSRIEHGYLTLQDQETVYTFGQADSRLQAHVTVNDPAAYGRVLWGGGTIAAGETYIEGLWDSPDVTQLIRLLVRNSELIDQLDHRFSALSQWGHRLAHSLRPNSKQGSKKNIVAHYDLGNDFYKLFLDETMMYSSAIFPTPETQLYEAQVHKLDTICQRLQLKAGEKVIEIGTGWGGLAVHAAEHYGVHVTTTTISDAQHAYVEQLIKQRGLEQQITLLKQDYRDLRGEYDKLMSVEMIEAVGHSHLPHFFTLCNRLLKPQGRLLIQAITITDQRYDQYRRQADFIQRYIFPGGFLPSISVMSQHIAQKTNLKISSLHDIGLDYAITLKQWSERLKTQQDKLKTMGLDHQFYRLWQFYLHYCEGGFRERLISTVHLVADKPRYRDYDHPALTVD